MTPVRNTVSGLSWSCAYNIYGKYPPNNRYAKAAAQLLIATAAHESRGFRHRRQMHFRPAPESLNGGFSLWQLQRGSIHTTRMWLSRRPDVEVRVYDWLSRHDKVAPPLDDEVAVLCHLQTPDGDPMGCVLARCHYLRVTPHPIPERIDDQAAYWLQHYNVFGCCKVKKRNQPDMTDDQAIELCQKDFAENYQRYVED
jgi:hypothetical protein